MDVQGEMKTGSRTFDHQHRRSKHPMITTTNLYAGIVRWFALFLSSLFLFGCALRMSHVQVREPRARAAVLVLPGLRNSAEGMRHMRSFYGGTGFDVHIPPYYDKGGMAASVTKLAAYIEENNLDEYEQLYAVVYLMGGRVLNLYLRDHELPNLTHVIYDRSPYQEQAPRIVSQSIPSIVSTFFGTTLPEFGATEYPSVPNGERRVGIVVECTLNSYMRRHTDDLVPVRQEDFLPAAFNQEHDDIIYVQLNHDEMYVSFDVIGPEILSFFERGRFTDDAEREPCAPVVPIDDAPQPLVAP